LLALTLDTLVISARFPGVAALAGGAALMIPVSVNVGGLAFGPAAAVVAATLLVLWAGTPRWIRPGASGERWGARLGPASSRAAAGIATMAAVAAAAWAAPNTVSDYTSVPLVDALPKVVYFGNGPSPLVDLGADLTERVSKEALVLTTAQSPPPYLRVTTLEDYSGDTWTHRATPPSATQDEGEDRLDLSPAKERPEGWQGGLGGGLPAEYEASVQVTGMRGEWLPVTFPPQSVTGLTGSWVAESGDDSIRAVRGNVQGQTYKVVSPNPAALLQSYLVELLDAGDTSTGQDLEFWLDSEGGTVYTVPSGPEGQSIAVAPGDGQVVLGPPPEGWSDPAAADLALPDGLPPSIAALAREVVADAGDWPRDQANVLQEYFRFSGLFAYSTTAPSQRGYDGDSAAVIAQFLEAKAGYCIHFAAAMTLMARTLGIPARIAIGYVPALPTDTLADGRSVYSVTTRSLHAWPELYLPDEGWAAFEPTPGRAPGAEAPADEADESALPSASPRPTASSSARPTPSASPSPSRSASRPAPLVDDAGPNPMWPAWTAVGLGLAAALGSVAGVWRGRRRARRFREIAAGGPGAVWAAWAEVRDTARDLGLGAPATETPKALAERLNRWWAYPTAANGPGPARNGPGPAGNGSGPARNGPGPARNGPGAARNGPGPARSGPGPAGNGPGAARNGPGAARNGPGPARSGPGPARSGPGPARSGPGPSVAGVELERPGRSEPGVPRPAPSWPGTAEPGVPRPAPSWSGTAEPGVARPAPRAGEAMNALAAAVEAAVFAPPPGPEAGPAAPAPTSAQTRAILEALRATVSRARRARARLLPISLVKRLSARLPGEEPPDSKTA
ncbi:MAG: transglutaminaseTgpA domain-containing protein, partial [Bifidobacteriaceae bacterium]|nr:transglutaminaseTgpA domain-containing protein [Bifidobacteriaceae bacterium]